VMAMRIIAYFLLTAFAFGLLAAPAPADDLDWKVGLAQVKITPEQPLFLAGYASRNRPFEKVATDLYTKALALEDRNGQLAVLVTTDLIGLSAAIAEPVCERLTSKAGLKREQILFNSSHIHTGPTLSLDPTPATAALRATRSAPWSTPDSFKTSSWTSLCA